MAISDNSKLTRRSALAGAAAVPAVLVAPAVAAGGEIPHVDGSRPDAHLIAAVERAIKAYRVRDIEDVRSGRLRDEIDADIEAIRPACLKGTKWEKTGHRDTVWSMEHTIETNRAPFSPKLHAMLTPEVSEKLKGDELVAADAAEAMLPEARLWEARAWEMFERSPYSVHWEDVREPADKATRDAVEEAMSTPARTFAGVAHKARLLFIWNGDMSIEGEEYIPGLFAEIEAIGGHHV